MTASVHKLTAGCGYDYLTRQVAAHDTRVAGSLECALAHGKAHSAARIARDAVSKPGWNPSGRPVDAVVPSAMDKFGEALARFPELAPGIILGTVTGLILGIYKDTKADEAGTDGSWAEPAWCLAP